LQIGIQQVFVKQKQGCLSRHDWNFAALPVAVVVSNMVIEFEKLNIHVSGKRRAITTGFRLRKVPAKHNN
jgi:hypothetical protein